MVSSATLDLLVPRWHWRSRSTLFVDAPAAGVMLAMEQVTLSELPGAAAHRARESHRDASGVTVLADLFEQGFFLLHEEADRELILGRVGQFWRTDGGGAAPVAGRRAFVDFTEPGHAKAVLCITACPWGSITLLAIENRVLATDDRTYREFNGHWLVGAWANAAGRQQLLNAVRDRATQPENRA